MPADFSDSSDDDAAVAQHQHVTGRINGTLPLLALFDTLRDLGANEAELTMAMDRADLMMLAHQLKSGGTPMETEYQEKPAAKERRAAFLANDVESIREVWALEEPKEKSREWSFHEGKNCFDGHGGFNADLESDNSHPKIMPLSDAKQMCIAKGYAGFTFQPSEQRVWWLREITNTAEFCDGGGMFHVYQLAAEMFAPQALGEEAFDCSQLKDSPIALDTFRMYLCISREPQQECDSAEGLRLLEHKLGRCPSEAELAPLQELLALRARLDFADAVSTFLEQGWALEGYSPQNASPLWTGRCLHDESAGWGHHWEPRGEVEHRVKSIWIGCDWKDQGWGNASGTITLELWHGKGMIAADGQIFGTVRSDGLEGYKAVSKVLTKKNSQVVARALPGDQLVLNYVVGGPGCQLHVEDLCLLIDYDLPTEKYVSCSEAMTADQEAASRDPTSLLHIEPLRATFPFKGAIAQTEHKGVTVKQLQSVLRFVASRSHLWRDTSPAAYSATAGQILDVKMINLHILNSWVLTPATSEEGCSFVECLWDPAAHEPIPTWFTSHWWGEVHVDFVRCVKEHSRIRKLGPDASYWVCAYANSQTSLSADVTDNPEKSSFHRAVLLCEGLVLILDETTPTSGPATPFGRIWVAVCLTARASSGYICCYEESLAVTESSRREVAQEDRTFLFDAVASKDGRATVLTDGLTTDDLEEKEDLSSSMYTHVQGNKRGSINKARRESKFPLQVFKRGLRVGIEAADATCPADKTHILNTIAQQEDLNVEPLVGHKSYRMVDTMLHSRFAEAAWLPALEAKQVRELELPLHLSKDKWRKSLSMAFSGISLSAEDVEDLVTAVAGMTSLMRLELDLDNTSIEDIDPLMAAVARLDNLRTLSVVLEHRLQVTEGWKIPWSSNNLEPLWSMPNLRSLSLDLRGVPFGQVDLLGKGLAKLDLNKLKLNLWEPGQVFGKFTENTIWLEDHMTRSYEPLMQGISANAALQSLHFILCTSDQPPSGGFEDDGTSLALALQKLPNMTDLSIITTGSLFTGSSFEAILHSISRLSLLKKLELEFDRIEGEADVQGWSAEALTLLEQVEIQCSSRVHLLNGEEIVNLKVKKWLNGETKAGCINYSSIGESLMHSCPKLTKVKRSMDFGLGARLQGMARLTSLHTSVLPENIEAYASNLAALQNLGELKLFFSDAADADAINMLLSNLKSMTKLQVLALQMQGAGWQNGIRRTYGTIDAALLRPALTKNVHLQSLILSTYFFDVKNMAFLSGFAHRLKDLDRVCLLSIPELGDLKIKRNEYADFEDFVQAIDTFVQNDC